MSDEISVYPPARDVTIAVAIVNHPRIPNQRHVGIMYRPHDSPVLVIHLAWMDDLRREEFSSAREPWWWVRCRGLDRVVLESFADWLDIVYLQNGQAGIPYGFDPYGVGDFTPEREYAHRGTCRGLTCASFVASCFACFQLDLIQVDTWPLNRQDDAERMKLLVDQLATKATPEFVNAQQALIGHVARFRPEEVAAAAHIFSGERLPFDRVEPLGVNLVAQMAA
jgi:hypothetical protein